MANSPSISAQKGRAFLLKVATGASPTAYVTASGLRATDLTINGNPVDITTKTSNGWRELLPDAGVQQVDITASGVWDSSSAVLQQVQAAAVARTLIEAEIISGAGDRFIGTWDVSQFKRAGTHNDAETFDITLQSSGPVIYSAT